MSLEELEVCKLEAHTLQKVKRLSSGHTCSRSSSSEFQPVPTPPPPPPRLSPGPPPTPVGSSSSLGQTRDSVPRTLQISPPPPPGALPATLTAGALPPRDEEADSRLWDIDLIVKKDGLLKTFSNIFVFRKEDHCVNKARPPSLSGKIVIS